MPAESTIPAQLRPEHARALRSRLQKRMDGLVMMLEAPDPAPVLIEKQRVLVMDAVADMLSIKHPREEGV